MNLYNIIKGNLLTKSSLVSSMPYTKSWCLVSTITPVNYVNQSVLIVSTSFKGRVCTDVVYSLRYFLCKLVFIIVTHWCSESH